MAFWTTDKTRDWVEAAESETGHSSDAPWASQLLSDDLLRWSRWGVGVIAFGAAFIASAVAGPLVMMLAVDLPRDTTAVTEMIAVLAVAAVVLVICVVVLWRLHRSGRRLGRALGWWLILRATGTHQGFADWVAPRAVLFKPTVFARVISSTVSGLVGIFGFSMIGYSITEDATLLLASVAWGVLGTASCFGQFGGILRLINGLGSADPVWNRIRGY